MAIYRLSASMISRGSGRSAVAAAAYRSGGVLREGRSVVAAASYRSGSEVPEGPGRIHDYTRKGGVAYSIILLPQNAPEWMKDREQLWNAVEITEKRCDAQLAREIQVAFPRELSMEQNVELLQLFVQREFVDRGMIADACIHNPNGKDGKPNPHAHVMLTTRVLTEDGFGKKERGWNRTGLLKNWRQVWAEAANDALERAGHTERIDHRSYEDQGIDREPEPKLGPNVYKIEEEERRKAANENRPPKRREELTDRGRMWVEVKKRNSLRERLEKTLANLKTSIVEKKREIIEEGQRRLAVLSERLGAAYRSLAERGATTDRIVTDEEKQPSTSKLGLQAKDTGNAEVSHEKRNRLLGLERPGSSTEREDISSDRLMGRKERGDIPEQTEFGRERFLGKGRQPAHGSRKGRSDDDRDR
jgi:ATP-dependent exoDNAse (exonuclease V) alpha subunit